MSLFGDIVQKLFGVLQGKSGRAEPLDLDAMPVWQQGWSDYLNGHVKEPLINS